MDLSIALELDRPTVISDEVDGETLVINLGTGAYYVIPEQALAVWTAISNGVPAKRLLDGAQDPRSAALAEYLQRLLDAGLLREAGSVRDGVSVRWDTADLDLEEHTDMADLLGLDPIHEADENVGWPKKADGA